MPPGRQTVLDARTTLLTGRAPHRPTHAAKHHRDRLRARRLRGKRLSSEGGRFGRGTAGPKGVDGGGQGDQGESGDERTGDERAHVTTIARVTSLSGARPLYV